MMDTVGEGFVFAPITISGMKKAVGRIQTSSPTYVMGGLLMTLSPITATRFWMTVNGQLGNDTNGRETDVVLCFGTGSAPLNGDPLTGDVLTSQASFIATSGGGSFLPFSLTAAVSDITPRTPYWFDIAIKVSGGTGTVDNVDICAMGLP